MVAATVKVTLAEGEERQSPFGIGFTKHIAPRSALNKAFLSMMDCSLEVAEYDSDM